MTPTCWMFALGALGALATQEPRAPVLPWEVADLRRADLDTVLRLLPPVGRDAWFDRDARAWHQHPATVALRERIDRGVRLSDHQWRTALQVGGVIELRARWPHDRPLAVSMRRPSWLGTCEVRLIPRHPGLRAARAGDLSPGGCGNHQIAVASAQRYQVLGELPRGEHTLTFDVEVELAPGPLVSREELEAIHGELLLWRGALTHTVTLVEAREPVVAPVSGPEIDAAVRDALSLSIRGWGPEREAVLDVDTDTRRFPELAATGLSLDLELLRGDAVVEAAHVTPTRDVFTWFNSRHDGLGGVRGRATLRALPPWLAEDVAARAPWSLRVTGTHEGALAQWHAERMYTGTLTIQVSELLHSAPGR